MLLLTLSVALADDRFFVGPQEWHYDALLQAGHVVGRTHKILLETTDTDALLALPDVADLKVLPGGVVVLSLRPGRDDLALARLLSQQPAVAWAIPDVILPIQPADLPNDPLLAHEWYLENDGSNGQVSDVDIDATTAWSIATGAGQMIAILDSGTQLDHPDLRVIPGYDYIDNDSDPSPGTSDSWGDPHGTCTAGIAAATGNNGYGVAGVAWNADIYAIRIVGAGSSLEDIYTAFVEAVDAGATVLSNSWGFSTDCSEMPAYSTFTRMYSYAETQGRGGLGAAVIFAAGNGNCDIALDGLLNQPTPIVVAALESNDQRASYSSFGETVDIAAPTTLLTTDMIPGGYGSYDGDDAIVDYFNGTSAATPVVAGVAALMFEANPRLTAAQLRDVLCETAVRGDLVNAQWDANGHSDAYGCGRVNAGAAVLAVANGIPDAPLPVFVAETAEEGHVQLHWEGSDPDADPLSYTLRWQKNSDAPQTVVLSDTSYAVDGLLAGDTVTWQVAASDAWGMGPWSETEVLTVVAPENKVTRTLIEAEGCQHGPSTGGVALFLGALWALRRPRAR